MLLVLTTLDKIWYTCFVCHKTYKCNLKRYINSSHMLMIHKCNICMKGYKRKEYLNRHYRKAHNTASNFVNITDCVTTDNSPDLDFNLDYNAQTSSDLDDVDTFLNNLHTSSIHFILHLSSCKSLYPNRHLQLTTHEAPNSCWDKHKATQNEITQEEGHHHISE